MFFEVFLTKPKKFVVVPSSWILGIDAQWEKFVNQSLNRNQKFLVFYSTRPEAIDADQRPNEDFVPDFDLRTDIDYPNEGCYVAKLVTFKSMYQFRFFI